MNSNAAVFLWDAAARDGSLPAIIEREDRTSYAELLSKASGYASGLISAGVVSDEPVGILLERGPDAAAMLFAVFAVGGIAVVIDEVLRPKQIEHILTHSGAKHVVSSEAVLARHPRGLETGAKLLDVRALMPSGSSGFVPAQRLEHDVAQIIYTSGSMGMPKGVAVRHGNLHAPPPPLKP